MTREEAIRILDPEFVANEFSKYDEEHGIRDMEHLKAIYDACVLAVSALREQEERSKPKEAQPMDVREKLIEILKTKYDHFCDQCGINKDSKYTENLASHLIAKGVTVQEWISVTERLPERDKEVLLIVHGWKDRLYYTGCLHRQEAERSWLTGIESKASDWTIWGFSYLREPIVTHWMPLPQPPKEEGT